MFSLFPTFKIHFLQLGQIHFAIGTNTFCNWGQIHFAIGRNTNRRCKMFFQCLVSPQLLFVTWINFPVIRPFIQFVEATKYNLYYRELSRTIGKSHITGREDKHVEENIFLQYEWLNREGTKRYFSFSKYSFNPSIGWSSSSTELYFWSLFGYMCQHTNTETNTKPSIAR